MYLRRQDARAAVEFDETHAARDARARLRHDAMLRVGPRLRVAQRRRRELARQQARRAVARQGGGGYHRLGALKRHRS